MADLMRCTTAHFQGNDYVAAGTILPADHELVLDVFFEPWEPPSASPPTPDPEPEPAPPVSEGEIASDAPTATNTEGEPPGPPPPEDAPNSVTIEAPATEPEPEVDPGSTEAPTDDVDSMSADQAREELRAAREAGADVPPYSGLNTSELRDLVRRVRAAAG